MRIAAMGLALLLAAVPAGAGAKELKPKFGNIDGVYYSDVSGEREACRQAVKNKMALCRQNTNFESNTKNRKYAGCLPIFRQQAQSCVVHFRHQMGKCDLSGAARITDFTGFGCEVTRTVVEEGGPEVAPLDARMRARTGSNLRAGPGTNHRVVGSLRTGQEVQVTGRAGDWLRIATPGGGAAFVHGSLLIEAAPEAGKPPRQPALSGKDGAGAKQTAAQRRCEKAWAEYRIIRREANQCSMNVLRNQRTHKGRIRGFCACHFQVSPRYWRVEREIKDFCPPDATDRLEADHLGRATRELEQTCRN